MVLGAHWYVHQYCLCLSCLPCVLFLVFCTVMNSSCPRSPSAASAVSPELGQICVDANGFRSQPHMCAPVLDLQPKQPTRTWVEGDQFFLGSRAMDNTIVTMLSVVPFYFRQDLNEPTTSSRLCSHVGFLWVVVSPPSY
jgi:hypothetical protein